MARLATTLAIALLALPACGKKRDADKAPPPPPRVNGPVAPPPPTLLTSAITLDEIRAHHPTLTGVRMTTEVALDPTGRQGLGSGCVTAGGAKVAMHQFADAYGVGRWVIKIRTTADADTRGEFGGDFQLPDGILHVRGVLAASPACKPGEVGLSLFYTKVVDAPRRPPPTPPRAAEPVRPAPTTP